MSKLPSSYYEQVKVELLDWMRRHGFSNPEVYLNHDHNCTTIEAVWEQNGELHVIANSSPHLLYEYLDAWHVGQHPYAKYGYLPMTDFDFDDRAKMILATHVEGEDFEDHLAGALHSLAAEAHKLGNENAQHKCVSRRVGDPAVTVYLHDGTKVAARGDENQAWLEVNEQAEVRAAGGVVDGEHLYQADLQAIKDAPFRDSSPDARLSALEHWIKKWFSKDMSDDYLDLVQRESDARRKQGLE